jgi:HK97 family phage major capsid protein
MTLKEEVMAKKEALAALKVRIEANDVDAIDEGAKLMAELEEKSKELEAAEKKAAVLGVIGKESKEKDMEEMKGIKGLDVERLKRERGTVSTEIKAYNSTHTKPTITEYDEEVAIPDEGRRVRDLFAQSTTSGNAVSYVVLGAREGDPSATNEGAAKPQIHYPQTQITESLQKIAAFVKDSDELLSDAPRLADAINEVAAMDLQDISDAYLVGELLDTSGVQQGASTLTFDNILKAQMDILNDTKYVADGIIINPSDWYTLKTAKDQRGQYLLGGPAFGAYGNGDYKAVEKIWGTLEVMPCDAMPKGQAIVGAFKRGGKVYTKAGEGIRVELSNSDTDDFQKNLVTIRCEERILLAVKKPDAFVIVGSEESGSGS